MTAMPNDCDAAQTAHRELLYTEDSESYLIIVLGKMVKSIPEHL